MIEDLNNHTVRLTPDAPTKRASVKRPKKSLNSLERLVIDSMKTVMTEEFRGLVLMERQIKKPDDYHRALAKRAILKTTGLPGYTCVPYCKVIVKTEELRRGGLWR